MKYGIFDWYGYIIDYRDNYKLIKQAGFDKVMLWWGEEYEDKKLRHEHAMKAGLAIENAHFTFYDINLLWQDTLDTQTIMDLYHTYIDDVVHWTFPLLSCIVPIGRLRCRSMTSG